MEQYDVLLQNFTPEEIVELDAISSPADIQELVSIIKGTFPLTSNQGQAIPRVSVYAAPNGCSYSPDSWGRANFKPTCNSHDRCYSSSSARDRKTCDISFYGNLLAECKRAYPNETVRRNACNGVASTYFTFVRNSGGDHYKGKGRNN